MTKKKKQLLDTAMQPIKVALVGLTLPTQKKEETQAHLEELKALACTAGLQVEKTFHQKLEKPHANMLLGKGKVEEIASFIKTQQLERIVFDDELSPVQTRNLEKACQCEVWDRSRLILKIFALHARTAQAKIQVELAQYQYLIPRLIGMWTHHSRQQGGFGTRGGPGEKELETDKRLAQQRMKLLKQKLDRIRKNSEKPTETAKKTN